MSNLPPDQQILTSVVGTLDLVILTRPAIQNNETFRLISPVPEWFADTFGDLDSMTERSLFLADFIEGEARECWQTPSQQVQSGLWQEQSLNGQLRFFEATAMTKTDQHVLVIALANERHDREQDYLQFAHDSLLFQRKLAKERERKEVLLDCIVNNLSNSLSTILMNIQFVEDRVEQEALTQALERAEHQAKQQRELIFSIADAFDSDLSKFEPALLNQKKGVDIFALATEVVESARPAAQKRKIKLTVEPNPNKNEPLLVLAEHSHLSRVMENLLNHLVQQGTEGDLISLQISAQNGNIKTLITNSATNQKAAQKIHIFEGMAVPLEAGESSKLGLYFCQMAVRHWGGKIEQQTTADGRNQISLELRKKAERSAARPANSN